MGRDERTHTTRVHERETAQIDEDVLPGFQPGAQGVLKLPDRRKVELAREGQARAVSLLCDVDGERRRLELSHPS
jgi:hypothetical protein